MRIDIVREPDVPAAIDASIMRLQQRAFPDSQRFRQTRHYTHVARPGDWRVLAWQDDTLIGQVAVMWAVAQTAAGPMRLACLGNVCSDPDYRGTHAASAAMERTIEQAAREGADGLLLFCREHLRAYYERFGFAEFDNELYVTRTDGSVYRRDHRDIRMVRMLGGKAWPEGEIRLDIEDF